MKATIQKWGNSLALRLPKALATEARLAEGSRVELVRTEAGVLLKPRRTPRYRLSELLARVTKKNIHPETPWGPDVGREIVVYEAGSGDPAYRAQVGRVPSRGVSSHVP